MDDSSSVFLQLQKLQTGEVTCCDFSLNLLLAIGSSDKNVRIMEWKTGLGFVDKFYSPFCNHKYAITSVKFSPKGTMLVSSSIDGTANLIDVLTGSKIFTMVQYNASSIKFCNFILETSFLITASDEGVLCCWDIYHKRQTRKCALHEDDYCLKALSITPDSQFLLSINSGNWFKLWFIGCIDSSQPQCLLQSKNLHDDVVCCEFSPIKDFIGTTTLKLKYCAATCGADNAVKIWNVIVESMGNTEICFGNVKCDLILLHDLVHENDILSLKFNPSGYFLATTGLDSMVYLWEVHTSNCLRNLKGHIKYVTCASFSSDSSLLVTGSIDKVLIVWDLTQNLTLDSDLSVPCNMSSHFTGTTNYNSELTKRNKTLKFTDFTVSQVLTNISNINCLLFLEDDSLVVAGSDKTVSIWSKKINKTKYELQETQKEHDYSINQLDAAPNENKIISCSIDGTIISWDFKMNLTYKMKTNSNGNMRTCSYSPNSKYIAAGGDDQKIHLWDASNLEFIRTLQQHEESITALAFTPDSKFIISVSCGEEIILQNIEEDRARAKICNAHDLGVMCCDLAGKAYLNEKSQSAYLLATGGNDSLVKLWTVTYTDISFLENLTGHGGPINSVKFCHTEPDLIASCSNDNTVRVYDTKTKYCIYAFMYHESAVTTCSFSKNSTLLATGSMDKKVFIVNLLKRENHEVEENKHPSSSLENWTTSELVNWFSDMGSPDIAEKIKATQLTGLDLFIMSSNTNATVIGLNSAKERKNFENNINTLKMVMRFPFYTSIKIPKVPHQFLCPITHLLMKDPVICSDGYTYDKAAILEWLISGKIISPITKKQLATTKFLPYTALKINIYKYLQEHENIQTD